MARRIRAGRRALLVTEHRRIGHNASLARRQRASSWPTPADAFHEGGDGCRIVSDRSLRGRHRGRQTVNVYAKLKAMVEANAVDWDVVQLDSLASSPVQHLDCWRNSTDVNSWAT